MAYSGNIFKLIGALALLTLAVGCASTGQTQNPLSAAGFKTIVATTPQQQQRLRTLPPNQMASVQRNGETYYVYADPAHNQIYEGNQAQFEQYQRLRWANRPQPFLY